MTDVVWCKKHFEDQAQVKSCPACLEKDRAELQAEVERLSKALEIKTIAFKGEFDEHVEDCKNYRAKLDVAREVLKNIKPVLDKHWFSTKDVGDGYVEDFNNDDVIEASEQVEQALEKIDE